MTRSELIFRLQQKHPELRAQDIETAVRLILESIGASLAQGDRVEIRGFGSFNVRSRPPRTARNPRTGETVQVPSRNVPSFKPGKEMRERIDGDGEQPPEPRRRMAEPGGMRSPRAH